MLPKLVTWDSQEAMRVTNNDLKQKISEDHMHKLMQSINLFKTAPVLDISNKLVPLNGPMDYNKWGKMIDFMNDPKRLLPLSKDFYSKAKIFDE